MSSSPFMIRQSKVYGHNFRLFSRSARTHPHPEDIKLPGQAKKAAD